MIAAAADAFPDVDWQHWIRYHSPAECKLACDDWRVIPEPVKRLLRCMLELRTPWAGEVPDMSLRGAGMHAIAPGGFLGQHRDATHHAVSGMRRVGNGILFLNEGDSSGDLRVDGVHVPAKQGRLVFFESSRLHGVPGPLTWYRKTLAVYWYDALETPVLRPRADFVELPQEERELRRNDG